VKYDFTSYAFRELEKLPKDVQRRIIEKLRFYLAQKNPIDFAEKIEGGGAGKVYRFRVGDYRLIFDWLGEKILVLKIRDRRDAYK